MKDRYYWLGFSAFPGVGPGRFALLLQQFEKVKFAWEASEDALAVVLGATIAKKLVDFRGLFSIEDYAEKLEKADVQFLCWSDPIYPKLLRKSSNPPFVLYVKGSFDFNSADQYVGVVGSRRVSDYGRTVTNSIVQELVSSDCVIVSGLAMGVDSVAHSATIRAGGKTVAVLGCGVDCCSPVSNQDLYTSIVESGGAVVSEMPLGMTPTKGSFPSRNRIIAGMSLGVVVTEGAADSGALITAKDAFGDGRLVFAVPGPIYSELSKGPYELIRKGATLVTNGKEILTAMGMTSGVAGESKVVKGETVDEQKVLDLLRVEILHFDTLVRRMRIDPSALGVLLTVMEMKGIVSNLGVGMWGINNKG